MFKNDVKYDAYEMKSAFDAHHNQDHHVMSMS